MYYSEASDGWIKEPVKPPVKQEEPNKNEPPEQQIAKLTASLAEVTKHNEKLSNDINGLMKERSRQIKKIREYEQYRELYAECQEMIEKLKIQAEEKEKKFTEVQSKIDVAVERAIIAETDVAEIKRKNSLKDGMFRSLKGMFIGNVAWRKYWTEPKIDFIFETIEKGLNTDKIKCQK